MKLSNVWIRIQSLYQRSVTAFFFRRPVVIFNNVPYISFTFDDFPCSSLHTGGYKLASFGLHATYYASLGLMGTEAPTGKIFMPDDIKELFKQGHELGCHTFAHCHSWKTNPMVFENSIIKNKLALQELVPGAVFKSFSYPITCPSPDTKRRVARHFVCCRGGGQSFNVGKTDLNYLHAFFLEKSRNNPDAIKRLIDDNCQYRGWLIFATHDISETPSPYGCTPSFFGEVVNYSLNSGARILPVVKTLETILEERKSCEEGE